jgi:transcriptional regulator
MYIPAAFKQTNPAEILAFLQANAFGLLVTGGGALCGSHIPFLIEERDGGLVLKGHLARANGQGDALAQGEVMVVFQGPHGYMSPGWVPDETTVPTWNYQAVHVYGQPVLLEGEDVQRAFLDDLSAIYEAGRARPWKSDQLAPGFMGQLMQATVMFEIPIDRIEAKWKLSQNKSVAVQKALLKGLEAEPLHGPCLADVMVAHGIGRDK